MTFDTARIFGMAGVVCIVLGVLIAALAYRGRKGEAFSLLNHFISELGEIGVSRRAWAFNGALILGGLALLVFNLSLGRLLDSLLGWLGAAAGMAAGLSIIGVGVFPMNRIKEHTVVAMTYFRSGLLMTLFYGPAVLLHAGQLRAPWVIFVFSLLALAAFAAFLLLNRRAVQSSPTHDSLSPMENRPRFWRLPFTEWLVFFGNILWVLVAALCA